MKRGLRLLAFAPILLGVGSASAAGINLGWNDCPGGATYSVLETFACDTNVGVHTMVGSFVAPAGVVMMSANEITIDFQTSGALVPAWWQTRSTYCRAGSLGSSFDFTGGPFTCYDYWQGGAIGALSEDLPGFANRGRIKGVFALPAGDTRITSVPEGTHVYSFNAILTNAKTTGLGACAGCGDEGCFVLQNIRLNQPPPLFTITLTNPETALHVLWQGWSTPDPTNQCPLVTPTRSRSWGSIKAIYR